MSYIPQLYQTTTPIGPFQEYAIVPWAGTNSYLIAPNGGTGYTSGDVGTTVTLTLPAHTPIVPATGVITGVSGGAITSFAPFTIGGVYVMDANPPGSCGITGGHGSGCTVNFDINFGTVLYTDNTGLGTTVTAFTVSFWGFLDTGNVNASICQNGISLQILWNHFGTSLSRVVLYQPRQGETGNPQVPIFDGQFAGYSFVGNGDPFKQQFNVLMSFDIPTRRIHLFINDVEWPFYGGGWISTNSITCTLSNFILLDQNQSVGVSNLWMKAAYTDLTVTENRRQFIDSSGNPVDPATMPSAPVNLYYNKGDLPAALVNNHGTGGNWSMVGSTQYFMRGVSNSLIRFNGFSSYDYRIANNATVTLPMSLDPADEFLGVYTIRPGATLAFSIGTPASNGTVSVTPNTAVVTYTPNTDFVGDDAFVVTATDVMPSGYTSPGWSLDIPFTVQVDSPDIPDPAPTGLPLITLSPVQLPTDNFSVMNESGMDLSHIFSSFPSLQFPRFSLSVWCCGEVHMRAPNGEDTPYTIDMVFSSKQATLQFYDFAANKLFSGTFVNPGSASDPYHVMFSIDTEADTYTFWVGNVAWPSSDAAFVQSGQIWNMAS